MSFPANSNICVSFESVSTNLLIFLTTVLIFLPDVWILHYGVLPLFVRCNRSSPHLELIILHSWVLYQCLWIMTFSSLPAENRHGCRMCVSPEHSSLQSWDCSFPSVVALSHACFCHLYWILPGFSVHSCPLRYSILKTLALVLVLLGPLPPRKKSTIWVPMPSVMACRIFQSNNLGWT